MLLAAWLLQASVPPVFNCSTTRVLLNTDLCPGGPPGYHNLEVSDANTCAEKCCADSTCAVWVMRNVSVTADNCTSGSTCCWLKPEFEGTSVSSGTTSGAVHRKLPGFHFIDTSQWVGSEYTPARAPNTLWWAHYDD